MKKLIICLEIYYIICYYNKTSIFRRGEKDDNGRICRKLS